MSIRTKIVLMILSMSVVFGSGILIFIYNQIQTTLRDEAINKTLILAEACVKTAAVQIEDLNASVHQGEAFSQPTAYCLSGRARRALSYSFEKCRCHGSRGKPLTPAPFEPGRSSPSKTARSK
jgi:hypothetical protein